MTSHGTVLIVGGTSDIGRATAIRYAEAGWSVQLSARKLDAAERDAADLKVRSGREVTVHRLDILERSRFPAFIDELSPLPDTVICMVGDIGEQRRAETDPEHAAAVLRANFEGPALLLGMFAERFAARGAGTIIGVSSVAGERGRASNYVYGAAKAGFTAFLSGLRQRLARRGVRVITVKPGFVRTRMTAAMKLPPLVTAEPAEVADAIFKADTGGASGVVYVRRIWGPIMTAIRAVPEPLFRRLSM